MKSLKQENEKRSIDSNDNQWVAICQYEYGADFEIFFGTYDKVLEAAGKYWRNAGLNFDMSRPDKFYVDSETGYSEEVEICMHKGKDKNKFHYISHADGEGPSITFLKPKRV